MSALCDLLSAGIIEKDSHGDVMWVWSYPTATTSQRELLKKKSCLTSRGNELSQFVYGQHMDSWYYIYTIPVGSSALDKVTAFSLVLNAKDFNPEKYEALCKILSKQYARTGNPAAMLQSYLAVVTRGKCNGEENGTFSLKEYDARNAYCGGSMKEVIEKFGIETILIYSALILKKKVVVYHRRLEDLLSIIRVFPAFVWHRQNWSILHPYLSLDTEEINDLLLSPSYVAGFNDPSVESRDDLYDIFVNATNNEIIVASHAKESFSMGKLHKDIAVFMVQCAEDQDKDNIQIIKDIAGKTKDLLSNLKGLAKEDSEGKPVIALETLREKKMPPATENFLFSLAAAEGWVPV